MIYIYIYIYVCVCLFVCVCVCVTYKVMCKYCHKYMNVYVPMHIHGFNNTGTRLIKLVIHFGYMQLRNQ